MAPFTSGNARTRTSFAKGYTRTPASIQKQKDTLAAKRSVIKDQARDDHGRFSIGSGVKDLVTGLVTHITGKGHTSEHFVIQMPGGNHGTRHVSQLRPARLAKEDDVEKASEEVEVSKPFVSQAQRAFMYSQHPELAREFESKTPKGKKLPEHVKKEEDLDKWVPGQERDENGRWAGGIGVMRPHTHAAGEVKGMTKEQLQQHLEAQHFTRTDSTSSNTKESMFAQHAVAHGGPHADVKGGQWETPFHTGPNGPHGQTSDPKMIEESRQYADPLRSGPLKSVQKDVVRDADGFYGTTAGTASHDHAKGTDHLSDRQLANHLKQRHNIAFMYTAGRDAMEGAHAVLHPDLVKSVRKDGSCGLCSGSGKIREGNRTCPDCDGSGVSKTFVAKDQPTSSDVHVEGTNWKVPMPGTNKKRSIRVNAPEDLGTDNTSATMGKDDGDESESGFHTHTKDELSHVSSHDLENHVTEDHGAVLAGRDMKNIKLQHERLHAVLDANEHATDLVDKGTSGTGAKVPPKSVLRQPQYALNPEDDENNLGANKKSVRKSFRLVRVDDYGNVVDETGQPTEQDPRAAFTKPQMMGADGQPISPGEDPNAQQPTDGDAGNETQAAAEGQQLGSDATQLGGDQLQVQENQAAQGQLSNGNGKPLGTDAPAPAPLGGGTQSPQAADANVDNPQAEAQEQQPPKVPKGKPQADKLMGTPNAGAPSVVSNEQDSGTVPTKTNPKSALKKPAAANPFAAKPSAVKPPVPGAAAKPTAPATDAPATKPPDVRNAAKPSVPAPTAPDQSVVKPNTAMTPPTPTPLGENGKTPAKPAPPVEAAATDGSKPDEAAGLNGQGEANPQQQALDMQSLYERLRAATQAGTDTKSILAAMEAVGQGKPLSEALAATHPGAIPAATKSFEAEITKTDEDRRLVFGWANLPAPHGLNGVQKDAIDRVTAAGYKVDLQGDIVPLAELENTAYNFVLNARNGGAMHSEIVGKCVESFFATPEKYERIGVPADVAKTLPNGWWVGFRVDDDDAWDRVKSGEYSMFSIGGRATRTPLDEVIKSDVAEPEPEPSDEPVAKVEPQPVEPPARPVEIATRKTVSLGGGMIREFERDPATGLIKSVVDIPMASYTQGE